MKKILTFLLCVIIVCALPLISFAEEEISTSADSNAIETESLSAETEIVTEGENSTKEDIAAITPDKIVEWAEENLEEISVVITLIVTLIYQVRKHTSLNRSIATCNNNAISIVENSNSAIQTALSRLEDVSAIVDEYKDEIITLLAEIRQTDEEKKRLENLLSGYEDYLKTAKLANVEFANEVAELLVLANIPNSKKDELYARHRAAVNAIDAVDHIKTEVNEGVGEEA